MKFKKVICSHCGGTKRIVLGPECRGGAIIDCEWCDSDGYIEVEDKKDGLPELPDECIPPPPEMCKPKHSDFNEKNYYKSLAFVYKDSLRGANKGIMRLRRKLDKQKAYTQQLRELMNKKNEEYIHVMSDRLNVEFVPVDDSIVNKTVANIYKELELLKAVHREAQNNYLKMNDDLYKPVETHAIDKYEHFKKGQTE